MIYKLLPKIFLVILLISHGAYAQTIVGSLKGEATNDMGMLNYRMALELPKGPNGTHPILGIKYNSGSNYGFNLYGASSFSRCSADRKIDGFSGGVNFDANDRYCLDGTRLINTSSADGLVNAQYDAKQKKL